MAPHTQFRIKESKQYGAFCNPFYLFIYIYYSSKFISFFIQKEFIEWYFQHCFVCNFLRFVGKRCYQSGLYDAVNFLPKLVNERICTVTKEEISIKQITEVESQSRKKKLQKSTNVTFMSTEQNSVRRLEIILFLLVKINRHFVFVSLYIGLSLNGFRFARKFKFDDWIG